MLWTGLDWSELVQTGPDQSGTVLTRSWQSLNTNVTGPLEHIGVMLLSSQIMS